jgi:cellulose biosynthesis protein BcsQ
VITEGWLAHADFYLAPAKPDYLSAVGLGLLGRLNTEAGLRGETFAANLGTLITMRRTGNRTDEHWARKIHREAPFRAFPMEVGLTVHIARAGEFVAERRTLAAKYPSPLTGLIGELSQEFVHRVKMPR